MTPRSPLRDALKTAASALRADGPPFALAGSYALWVHGGPEPVHDVDLVVAEVDAERAAATLHAAGFDIERPPEPWLFKAIGHGGMVDVLHRVNGDVVDATAIADAVEYEVLAVRMPVLSATEVIIQKLRSLTEHHCDFAGLLPGVRAVREQLDWPRIAAACADNAFAAAFLFLAERLDIAAAG